MKLMFSGNCSNTKNNLSLLWVVFERTLKLSVGEKEPIQLILLGISVLLLPGLWHFWTELSTYVFEFLLEWEDRSAGSLGEETSLILFL
jgi:hypothetical protein